MLAREVGEGRDRRLDVRATNAGTGAEAQVPTIGKRNIPNDIEHVGKNLRAAAKRAFHIVAVVTEFIFDADVVAKAITERSGDDRRIIGIRLKAGRERAIRESLLEATHTVPADAQTKIPTSGITRDGRRAERHRRNARQGDHSNFHFLPSFQKPTGRDPPTVTSGM